MMLSTSIFYKEKFYYPMPYNFFHPRWTFVCRTKKLLEYINLEKERLYITTSLSNTLVIHGVDVDFFGWPYR